MMMLSILRFSLALAAPLVKFSLNVHHARTKHTLTVANNKATQAKTPLRRCMATLQEIVITMLALCAGYGNL